MAAGWVWRGFVVAGLIASGLVAWACSSDESASPSTTPDGGGSDAGQDVEAHGTADLGAACSADSDCIEGLSCWTAATGGAWPAGGVCSTKCAGDDECAAVGSGSKCLEAGWCAEPCTLGPASVPSLKGGVIATKCHGRHDIACSVVGSASARCIPMCNDDGNCVPNAKCNHVTGLCEQGAETPWDQLGTSASGGTCPAGLTRARNGGNQCLARCTLGVVPSCNWDGGVGATSACVFRAAEDGFGDEGACVRLCDCNTDCPSGRSCTVQPYETETGRKGMCGGNGVLITCSDGGADAGDGGDGG